VSGEERWRHDATAPEWESVVQGIAEQFRDEGVANGGSADIEDYRAEALATLERSLPGLVEVQPDVWEFR
jgi:hypothetical protein